MSEEHEPRAGTVGSLERRVDKLESVVNGLVVDVAVIKTGQANQTNLMTSQHASLIGQLNSLAGELRGFITSASVQSSEPAATPAGRALLATLAERDRESAELAKDVVAAKAAADKALLWVARIGGVAAAGLAALTIFAPVIRHWLGIPG